MPLAITTVPDKTPVPFAKTKEYQDLQTAINNAKQSLDDVSEAVVAIEAKQRAQAALAAQSTTPDTVPIPMAKRGFEPDPEGQTFEESIAEMRRIAGLRN